MPEVAGDRVEEAAVKIDIAALIACGVEPTQARTFAEPLAIACERFDIVTPARFGRFVAQCRVESANFTRLEESLWYTTAERIRSVFPTRVQSLADAATLVRNPQALANRVYAGRLGNRDEASGDGFVFRGRGILQLTGRDNYADASVSLARPYIDFPALVALPPDACLTAAWFWSARKLNLLADAALDDEITRAINGPAMLHADLRRQYAEEATQALA